MIWLYGYFGIGATMCLWHIARSIAKSGKVDAIDVAIIFIAWPVMLYSEIFERSEQHVPYAGVAAKKKPFAVAPEQVGDAYTLKEIELKEMVCDPLQGAPMVPFGHLNAQWERFKQRLASGDTLAAFNATDRPRFQTRAIFGYVILRKDKPREYFLTGIVEDMSNEGSASSVILTEVSGEKQEELLRGDPQGQ